MDKLTSEYTFEIKTSGSESTPPNPERTKDAFARIGYSLEESISDLIDNSIDAGASDVLVRFVYDRKKVQRIFVVDNGSGMKEEILRRAMQFGSTLKHDKSDLGKYGIGLKSASLSQCEQFAVITRNSGEISGRRWSSASFDKDWLCEKLDASGCAILLAMPWAMLKLKPSGTIVMWESLTCLQTGDLTAAETVNKAIVGLSKHLGLVFHRFISKKRLNIHLDSQITDQPEAAVNQAVSPLDPFNYQISGAKNYPKDFRIRLEKIGGLTLKAHIWPRKSLAPGYLLGGGKVSSRQGFYFYRNDRLIQAGGWNGYRHDDSEPHVSLARVAIDLPSGAEGHFDVTVQKSKVNPPKDFIETVRNSSSGSTGFSDYVTKAIEVYRKKSGPEENNDFPLVPWEGLSSHSRDMAREILAPEESRIRKVSFHWKKNMDAGTVFELDRDRRHVNLNEMHRKSILGGSRRSKSDAQLFKGLVFLLVKEYFDHHAMTRGRKEFLDKCNRLLLHCIND